MIWTDEQTSELKSMWGAGFTSGEIASALDVSRCAVMGKINRLGIQRGTSSNPTGPHTRGLQKQRETRVRELQAAGYNQWQIAEIMGISRTYVSHLSPLCSRRAPHEIQSLVSEIARLREDGFTVKEIGQRVGLAAATVYYHLRGLNKAG